MCLKNFLFMVLVYIAVHPAVKAAEEIIVPQEFEKILSDFIFQYHKDNATDVCQKPVEKYISENFTKSKLYEELQLDKYFAKNSKCENLCLTVNYKFEENEENIDFNDSTTVQITVDISTSTPTSIDTTVDTSIDTTPTSTDTTVDTSIDTTPTSTDTTVDTSIDTTPISTDTTVDTNIDTTPISTDTTVDTNIDTTPISTDTTVDTSIDTTPTSTDTTLLILHNRNDFDETAAERSANEENSQNVTGTATQKKQEIEGGKKTAIIVSATVVSVAATAVASYFVATWVNTLLKSGTYVFPATHNA